MKEVRYCGNCGGKGMKGLAGEDRDFIIDS